MKKRIAIILCVIIATTLLAACAGAGDSAPPVNRSLQSVSEPYSIPEAPQPMSSETAASFNMHMELADHADYKDSDYVSYSGSGTAAGESIAGFTSPVVEGFAEKIIYTVFADIETVKFDETIAGVNTLIANYSAFIENSSISGRNHASQFYGWSDYRTAHYTIRVPKGYLDAMTGGLESIGNVLQINSNASNITSQFIDTQSRLNSLKIQEERLLDMLSKAEDVPDLIMIEERLSHVRYQIESLTTTLNAWQNQVDYSTLTLYIREVEQFTERTEIHRTYWQQIGDGFMSTMRSVGRFFMNFFKWLIVSAPVLVILAVIAVATLIIVRKALKSKAKKKASSPKPASPYQYPPTYGHNYAAPPTEPQNPDNDTKESE